MNALLYGSSFSSPEMLWNSSPSKRKTQGNTKGIILDVECNISKIYHKGMRHVRECQKSERDWNVLDLTEYMRSDERRLSTRANSFSSFLTKWGDFSSDGKPCDPSQAALASSQHIKEMAPKLARWSLDSLRGENELARMKTFPTGRQRVSARGVDLN